MGLGGISVWQLLIVLAIALCIFGTGRLKNIGADLGGAIKGFRKAMEQEDAAPSRSAETPAARIAEDKREAGAAGQAALADTAKRA